MPPFGRPFKYTETLHFLSDKKPWWKFWGTKKEPVAWLAKGRACDDDGEPRNLMAQAYLMPGSKDCDWNAELRLSPIEPSAISPLYDQDTVDDLIIAQESGRLWVDHPYS